MTSALEYLSQAQLAIAPRYLGHMLAVLQGRTEATRPRAGTMLRGRIIGGIEVVDGIAVVPMVGPVFQRADLFSDFGAVTVNDLRASLGAAIADSSVSGILLVVDSPGGEVAGVADLADDLFAARAEKPMLAVADEGIFSAAYWLASAVGPVVLPRTGSVGSIGALVVHSDVSQMLEKLGVRLTVIKSGEKKAQYNPFEPLKEDARAALQLEVDRVADLFSAAVARHRGLTAAAVRGFEAGTFEGDAAVTAGLADAVQPVDAAFLMLKQHVAKATKALAQRPAAAAARPATGARRERTASMDEDKGAPQPTPPATPEVETVDGPKKAPSLWGERTNVVNIEQARDAAKRDAQAAERRRAAEIIHWCAFANKADHAETFIDSEMTVEQVRAELLQITASASFDVHSGRPGTASNTRAYDSIETIYARRRAAIVEAQQNRRYW